LIKATSTVPALPHEVRAAKTPEVLRDCRTGDRKCPGNLAGRLPALAQEVQYGAAGRIGQGGGRRRRGICDRPGTHIRNHMVSYLSCQADHGRRPQIQIRQNRSTLVMSAAARGAIDCATLDATAGSAGGMPIALSTRAGSADRQAAPQACLET